MAVFVAVAGCLVICVPQKFGIFFYFNWITSGIDGEDKPNSA